MKKCFEILLKALSLVFFGYLVVVVFLASFGSECDMYYMIFHHTLAAFLMFVGLFHFAFFQRAAYFKKKQPLGWWWIALSGSFFVLLFFLRGFSGLLSFFSAIMWGILYFFTKQKQLSSLCFWNFAFFLQALVLILFSVHAYVTTSSIAPQLKVCATVGNLYEYE